MRWPPDDALALRLVRLAAALDLPGLGPRVEDAVALALDLVVADRATPATVAVASFGRGATLRDAGGDIREMLREQGTAPPAPRSGTDAAYATALWAVGYEGLSIGEFSTVFYTFLPPLSEQSAMEKKLAVLLHNWECESDLEARKPLTVAIRRFVLEAADVITPLTRPEVENVFLAVLDHRMSRDQADRWATRWVATDLERSVNDRAVWWGLTMLIGIDTTHGPGLSMLHSDEQIAEWLAEFRQLCATEVAEH